MSEAVNTDPAYEALCKRCGASCHAAIPVNGLAVVIPGICCRYLADDGAGRYRCTVYERRFEVAPWCHTAEEAKALGLLGQGCPYTAALTGYRGKARLHPRLLDKVLPAVRAELLRHGAPAWVSVEGCLALLDGAGDGPYEVVPGCGADPERGEGRLRFRKG